VSIYVYPPPGGNVSDVIWGKRYESGKRLKKKEEKEKKN
jgi:hypothetical protein